MTVPASQPNRYTYAGNGVTTAFAYNSKFLADADLVVVLVNTTTGVETVQTITTHYTVTGAGTSAGTVTFVTAPPTGNTVVIYGDPVLSQLVDPNNGDDFNVDAVIEAPLDKLTILVRRVKDIVTRTLRQPEGDTADIDRLPTKASRASKFLAFDSDGDPIAAAGTTGGVTVSAFMETLLDDADAAAARTTLGFAGAGGTAATANIEDAAVTAAKLAAAVYASQGEAQAGTENTKLMTALRVAQAISSLAPKLKAVSTTRDVSLSSGNVAVTGAGFAPKAVIVAGVTGPYGSSANQVGFGFGRSASEVFGISNANNVSSGTWTLSDDRLFDLNSSGVNFTTVDLVTLDADGCTLSYTKNGSPSGTANIQIMFIG